MLKGVNKRVIIIKNPDSEIFEEAYFIVKSGRGFFKQAKENDMVDEANRIIADYSRQQKSLIEKEKKEKSERSERSEKSEKSKKTDMTDIADTTEHTKKTEDSADLQNLQNLKNLTNYPNPSHSSNSSRSSNSANSANSINFSGGTADAESSTAEIDKFISEKIKSLERPKPDNLNKSDKTVKTEKNEKSDKTAEKNILKSHSMSSLTDEEIFEDEKFFENIKNKNDLYDLNRFNEHDVLNDLTNLTDLTDLADLDEYDDFNGFEYFNQTFEYPEITGAVNSPGSKFKLISSRKIRKFKNFPPPKSFFIGVGFMSAVVIAVRIFEFIFSK